jgi:hypothetical protein
MSTDHLVVPVPDYCVVHDYQRSYVLDGVKRNEIRSLAYLYTRGLTHIEACQWLSQLFETAMSIASSVPEV